MRIRRAEFEELYGVEALEPRIMLSADGFGGAELGMEGPRIELGITENEEGTAVEDGSVMEDFGIPMELVSVEAVSATSVWTNPEGGDWNESTNWAEGAIPESGDAVQISGLNEGAAILLSGDTPVLNGLSLEGGRLEVSGSLNTGNLELSEGGELYIKGGVSEVTGDVQFAEGTAFELQAGAKMNWSGSVWDQGGFAHVNTGTELTVESGRLETSQSSQYAISGTVNFNGGSFVIPENGAVNLYHASELNLKNTTVSLDGGVLAAYNESVVSFDQSELEGIGTYKLNHILNFGDSVLRPGTTEREGKIEFIYGEDNVPGAFNLTGEWSIELDIATESAFDSVSIKGTVNFGGDGTVVLNAGDVDFEETPSGTLLGGNGILLEINGGSVSGSSPDIEIIAGSDQTVEAEWKSSDQLTVSTYSPITARWINSTGGEWTDANYWANGRIPEAGETVVITELDEGAAVTVSGHPVEVGELSITGKLILRDKASLTVSDGGTVALTDLTVIDSELSLGGTVTLTTEGDVSIDSSSTVRIGENAQLRQKGGTWQLDGDAFFEVAGSSEWTQEAGKFEVLDRAIVVVGDNANWRLSGGSFRMVATSSVELFGSSNLTIEGGTINLGGAGSHLRSAALIDFKSGKITGNGLITANGGIQIGGTIEPGDDTGEIGRIEIAGGFIDFVDTWRVSLAVKDGQTTGSDQMDVVQLSGEVRFGDEGVVVVDVSLADFGATEMGTEIGGTNGVFYLDGTVVSGTVSVEVISGEDFTVEARWESDRLKLVTASTSTVGTTVEAGLEEAADLYGRMLSGFDLGTINFAGLGLPAFLIPSLPENLGALFDLSGLKDSLELPGIGSATSIEEVSQALESAGYQVEVAPEDGVALRGSLTNILETEIPVSAEYGGTGFEEEAGLLSGLADEINLTAALDLVARLMAHIIFELRDGVFHILSDSYLGLVMTGGAALSGTVRQGGRTVSTSGRTEVAAELRVFDRDGANIAVGEGNVKTTLELDAEAVELHYERNAILSYQEATLETSGETTTTLSAVLTLGEVRDGEGNPTTFGLTGTLSEDGESWTLAGAGEEIRWLSITVREWNFNLNLSQDDFVGSGHFSSSLDFLESGGLIPEVDLSAQFDQEEITFNGALNVDEIEVVNPAGGNYLHITDFVSTATITGNFDTNEWTGALSFGGGESEFSPTGSSFEGKIRDGDDDDSLAVKGSYNFVSQEFVTTVDQITIVAEDVLRIATAGVTLRHQRGQVEEQELASVEKIELELLFLSTGSSTGPPLVEATDISIRTNGFTIGSGSLKLDTVTMGSALWLTDVSVGFNSFSFMDGVVSSEEVRLEAASAQLFPEGEVFSATASGLSGSYDFGTKSDRIGLSAETLSFAIDGLVDFEAEGLTLRPEGEVIVSAESVRANLPSFGLEGQLDGLEIDKEGTASAVSFSLNTTGLSEKLDLAGILPVRLDEIEVNFLGDLNGNGVRDAGEVFRLDAFDLGVSGRFDFTVLDALPFSPYVKVGEEIFDEGSDQFAVKLRFDEGTFTIWETPTITLGIEELKLGELLEVDGSITLGGYEGGEWIGAFGGNLSVASLNDRMSGKATAEVNGLIDVEEGSVSIELGATLDLGIGETITLGDSVVDVDLKITKEGTEGLRLTVEKAAMTVGSLTVAGVFRATEVKATLEEVVVDESEITIGSIGMSAEEAELLPDNERGIGARTTGISGSYDFSTDGDIFELKAATLEFELEGIVRLSATEVRISPNEAVIFSVASSEVNLPGLGVDGAVEGFELSADGTPTAASITVNTTGLTDKLNLGGLLPFDLSGMEVKAPEAGGRIGFSDFDLTVEGSVDFGVFSALPFTPTITIGDQTSRSGETSPVAFSFTVRMDGGVIQIWETPTITLGIEELKLGELLEIDGSITLGGYEGGAWIGAFGGNLSVVSLNERMSGKATAEVNGLIDVEEGSVSIELGATLDLGIGETITLGDSAVEVDLKITKEGTEGLRLTVEKAAMTVGSLTVAGVFRATEVKATLEEVVVDESGITIGSIGMSAEEAELLPDNERGIGARTTGISGSYDFSTDGDIFELKAATVEFELEGIVRLSATEIRITPNEAVIFSVASSEVNLPGLGVDGAVEGFELSADGTPTAASITVNTTGLTDRLNLGGLLPFDLSGMEVKAPEAGGRIGFSDFDLTVEGSVDFRVFSALPFTPTITIGDQTSRSGETSPVAFSFTVRMDGGVIQIWETPTITLGIEELKLGGLLEVDGSITLGGYEGGAWIGAFGGSLTVAALQHSALDAGDAPASASVEIGGLLDVPAGSLELEAAVTVSFGVNDQLSFYNAGLDLGFKLLFDSEGEAIELKDLSLTASVGRMEVGTVLEATEVRVGISGVRVTATEVSLETIDIAVGTAVLFPESDGFSATVIELSGSYDFRAEGIGLSLTAGGFHFSIPDLIEFEASEVVLKPEAEIVVSIDLVSVNLPGIGVSGEVSGFELTSGGLPSALSLNLDTSGLAESLRLGGILPFDISQIGAQFHGDTNQNGVRDAGEVFRLDRFDLTVTGGFDFTALGTLPFTPILKIGDSTADDGSDSFTFTIRVVEGKVTPWELGPIEMGIADLGIGESLTVGGSVRLGGYEEGVWVHDFGGTLQLEGVNEVSGVSGALSISIGGSLDVDTGRLDLTGAFSVSFSLGSYVTVKNAAIGVKLEIQTETEESGKVGLSDTTFEVSGASVEQVSVTLGDLLGLEATDATFDFEAEGNEALIEVTTLTATLKGLGISGTASHFAVGANGSLMAREGFGVTLSVGEGTLTSLQWPDWLPIEISVFELNWKDLNTDPLDFTIRLSASVGIEKLSGSHLTLEGTIEDLVIDVGALKSGAFPILNLGQISIAVGGKISSAEVSAGFVLGILKLDAEGHAIEEGDTKTEVADGLLWGAIRGSINIAGYGGFEVFLGLSEYGPLQGYIKATVPITIPYVGIAFTDFRGGITFNSQLESIDDPEEMKGNASFQSTGDLSYSDWVAVLEASLAAQVEAHAESGNFGVLLSPFVVEGGVTIFSIYASTASFNIKGDFKMDSTGKFLARGAFQLGGTFNFTANLYIDMSRFITEGNGAVLFLAELPSELPVVTLYGALTFDFGTIVDPDNPPAAPFEQFTIRLAGGAHLGISGLPGFTVEGEVAFEVALNAPSLHVTLSGSASLPFLGEVIGVAGDFKVFFDQGERIQTAGILVLTPADFSLLDTIGVTMEGLVLLRFNSTDEAIDYTLSIPGQEEARTFTVAAGEGSILVEGVIGLAPLGTELFRLGGVMSMTFSDNGLDVLVSAVLTAGPVAAPLLRFDAKGYLHFEVEGIAPGMAAELKLSVDTDKDVLASLGLEIEGDFEFMMNTTGADVDFVLPTELGATREVERIHLPRGPPSADGATESDAEPYLIVRAKGILNIEESVRLKGVFDFEVKGGVLELDYEAIVQLGIGELVLYQYNAEGSFRIDETGVYGQADLVIDAGVGLAAVSAGFQFQAVYQLRVNTTNAAQVVGTADLEKGIYAEVRASGVLVVGLWRLVGNYDLRVGVEGIEAAAVGTVGLGVGEVEFVSLEFRGTMLIREDGIFAQMSLSEARSAPDVFGFGFGAGSSYELSLNTTSEYIDGIAGGLGARVVVTGSLEIGNLELAGVYELNATTTGIGLVASAALIFKAGDDELFRVPLEFEVELDFPGIVETIDLAFSLDELGINIPGLELSGAAKLVINTTGKEEGTIPAGPILQFRVEGKAIIGGLALDGDFGFESHLGGTQLTARFDVNLGAAGETLLSFSGEGAFELTLLGVAGYVDLSLKGGDEAIVGLFNADFVYFIEANTRPVPYVLGDRELAAGPVVRVGATGRLSILGLDFEGDYALSAGLSGVQIEMRAKLELKLPELSGGEITLMGLRAEGGFSVGKEGILAAFELKPETIDFEKIGLSIDNDSSFSLRVNTTGVEQTLGTIELEGGRYARIEFSSTLNYGVFRFEGLFRLSMVDKVAELLVDSELIVELPGIGGGAGVELFRMGAQGGFRIGANGVIAAFELDRGALDRLTLMEVGLPIGANQTFQLKLNTTGEAQTLGTIELEAGVYLKIVTTGELEMGLARLTGYYSLIAGETGLEVVFDTEVFVGIPGTELGLYRFQARGGLEIKANGVAGAWELEGLLGLGGLETIGLKMESLGTTGNRYFRINTTGEEIRLGDVVLEAGHYIEMVFEDSISIGFAKITGDIRFYLGEEGLIIETNGLFYFGLPEAEGVPEFTLYQLDIRSEWHITSEGIYGRASITEEMDPLEIYGFKLTPDYSVGPVLSLNTTENDQTIDGEVIRAGSVNLAMRADVEIAGQKIVGELLLTIDYERQIIAGYLHGHYEVSMLDWTPFSYDATGIILIAARGVGMDLKLDLDGGEGIPGVSINGDWNLRASYFEEAETIEGFRAGAIVVPTYTFDAQSVFRIENKGTMQVGGLLLDGAFIFEIVDDPIALFDTTLTVSFEATVRLVVFDTTLLSFDAVGGLSVSVDGIYGGVDLVLKTGGFDRDQLGFDLDASYRLEVNTTGEAQMVGSFELPAGPFARVEAEGAILVGAMRLTGTYGFSVGEDGVLIDSKGTVSFGLLGVTFYQFSYDGEFVLETSGLYAELKLSVNSSGQDAYGFGFSAGSTYTLGINTTNTERGGIGPGLGGRVQVEGDLEIGELSMDGVYELTATTTGIGFAASAALVLRAENSVLLEVPLTFSYELKIPGIVDEIALELRAEDLGLDLPGLELAGKASIVINTTGVAEGEIPAGPILQLAVEGTATIGTLDLNGRFEFESALNRTRMIAEFGYTLGDSMDPLLEYRGTGGFNIGLDGIVGVIDLEMNGGDRSIRDVLGSDLSYELVVNTTGSEYELFDLTVPAGPIYRVEAHGSITIGGLSIDGDFLFGVFGDGLLVLADAELDMVVPGIDGGSDLTLFAFELDGGISIDRAGVATALELHPTVVGVDAFGFEIDPEMSYGLAINTTGEERMIADVELEAGVYARMESRGSLSFGIAEMTGLFSFEVNAAGVVEMETISEVEVTLPGVGELFRFSQTGGFRFDSKGVIAAIDWERSGAADRLEVGGITLPFTAEQSFQMRMNTTGEAREIAGVQLEAGSYLAIETESEIDLGILHSTGPMRLLIGENGLDIELSAIATVGISGTAFSLYDVDFAGNVHIGSDGVYAGMTLDRRLGLNGLSTLGIDFGDPGASETMALRINTTGKTQQAGGMTLEAGDYIEILRTGLMTIGVASFEGAQRMYAGSEGFILESSGTVFVGLPGQGDFEGLTIFEGGVDASIRVTSAGAWGLISVRQTRDVITVGGIQITPDFETGIYLGLNTSTEMQEIGETKLGPETMQVVGSMKLGLLGQKLAGQVVMTVDWDQGYGAIAFDGTASIGIGDWDLFEFDADGYILIGEAGAVTNLNLELSGGEGVGGVEFEGEWALRASTMSSSVTVAGFSTSGLEIPTITIEGGNMLRTHLSGSIKAGGIDLEGSFDFAANSTEFAVYSKGTVSTFGTTTNFDGMMYFHPDRGFVANMQMEWGGINNAFMEISGEAYLRINTWNGEWEQVTPETFEIGIVNAVLKIGFSELKGSASIRWAEGVATLWSDMTFAPIPGLSATIKGWVRSDGSYNLDFSGGTEKEFGVDGLMTLSGSYSGSLNNAGLNGSWSGRIDWPNDYSSINGSFNITIERMELNLVLPRTWLLGIGVISGEVTLVAENGRLSLTARSNAPLRMEVAGGVFEARIWGTIDTLGNIDFTGTSSIDLGDQSLLRVRSESTVTISNSGFSAVIDGRIDVLNTDWTRVHGSIASVDGGFDLTLEMERVWLLGLGVASGKMEMHYRSGDFWMAISENSPLTLEVAGGLITATVWGVIGSDGTIQFTGISDFNIGSSTLGAEGSISLSVNNEGISGTVSGRLYVPGDFADYSGSFRAGSWGFDLTADSRFVLLGGLLLLDGGLRMEMRDGVLTFQILNMAGQLSLPGFTQAFGVSGWIKSTGTFSLSGDAVLDVGNDMLGVKGNVAIVMTEERISGSASGRVYVPGDYGEFSGSILADSDGFELSIDRLRYVLLGGVVLLDGSFLLEARDGVLSLELRQVSAELRLSGFAQTISVSGRINSIGEFDLRGQARLDIGSKQIGAEGTIDLSIANTGISGSVLGTVYVPGDYAGFSGHFEGGSWGFNLSIERIRFVVASGNILLDGSMKMELRDGNFTIYVPSIRAELWGLSGTFSGWFEGNTGRWRVDGSIGFSYGGDVGASGRIDVDVGSDNFKVEVSGSAWARKSFGIFGTHGVSGSFSGSVDLGSGAIDVSLYWWKFSFSVKLRFKGGFRIWLSNVEGSTVFLDVNRNGNLDDDEPWTIADENGNFDFSTVYDPDAEGNELLEGEVPVVESDLLGALRVFDLNGDGIVDDSEIKLYAVNGVATAPEDADRLVFRDTNGNGKTDEGELSGIISFDEYFEMETGGALSDGNTLLIFDDNGDGVVSEGEMEGLVIAEIGEEVPLILIPTLVEGVLPIDQVDFVFADANGNGAYDEGEPKVVTDAYNRYTFASYAASDMAGRLGRLAPFDRNGNGTIDSDEGVFVISGGTDRDNGVSNPIAASGLASGYGSGLESTISPLTTLQVSLVDRGYSQDEAADLIENAFDLPETVDIDNFDPSSYTSSEDPADEAAVLKAGASLSTLVTGGASLLGDDADGLLQDAVIDELAALIAQSDGKGNISIDLIDLGTLKSVIEGAGTRLGLDVEDAASAAAATILSGVNKAIEEAAASGGDVDRELADDKAVLLSQVNLGLERLGRGTSTPEEVMEAFSEEALERLREATELEPTEGPELGVVEDVKVKGADTVRIAIPVEDRDSRASELTFSVTSSNSEVMDASESRMVLENGEWFLEMPTEAVSEGGTEIVVTVSDGESSDTLKFEVRLEGINPAVQLEKAIGSQTLISGEQIEIDLSEHFTDPDEDTEYYLTSVGSNEVVDLRIEDGILTMTARTDLSGFAMFNLVATDGSGTVATRFSVVTYPELAVGKAFEINPDGTATLELRLSNPSLETLTIGYTIPGSATLGKLTLAAGETVHRLTMDLGGAELIDLKINQLNIGVNGSWGRGEYRATLDTRTGAELFGLHRIRVALTMELKYQFMVEKESGEEEDTVIALSSLESGYDKLVVESGALDTMTVEGQHSEKIDLEAASSLEGWMQPRRMKKL